MVSEDETKLTEHMKEKHEYGCQMCEFIGNTEAVMEHHILLEHINPGNDSMFSCDECDYKCKERSALISHYTAKHKNQPLDNGADDISKLKNELKFLKSSFERLETLYHESLDEVEKTKSEYEAKLMEAHDIFRNVKAENEELKEKVDVLFKLGRSYINRKEDKANEAVEEPVEHLKDNAESIAVEEVIEITEDNLQDWTKNKLRGFKRTGPATYAEKVKEPKTSQTNTKKQVTSSERSPSPSTPNSTTGEKGAKKGRTLYCHFFSNHGKCPYEERTGEKCKFVHDREAPMCSNGMSCSRTKCMFKHPNTAGRRAPFLGQNIGFNQNLNPWQMMNPWWNMSQAQSHMIHPINPWGMDVNMKRR